MTASRINQRDDLLDIGRGLGIMLVVFGHTLQGLYTDFDQNLAFRIIYSFHMPLFFFISGAVLCIKNNFIPQPIQSNKVNFTPTQLFLSRCKKSFLHLMVPFLVWTVILFYTGKRYEEVSFLDWIFMVIKSVDYSLWFLIALFNCLVFFHLSQYLFSTSGMVRYIKFNELAHRHQQVVFLVSTLLFSMIIAKYLPNWMGISFFKHYYIYLIIGGLWQVYFRDILPSWLSLITVLVFILLLPFWYRIEPSSVVIFLSQYIKHNHAETLYKLTVAISGTLTILVAASLIQRIPYKIVKNTFSYFGTMSLGIYVFQFQFQFLGIKPYFFAPLLLSLSTCLIISRIPIIKLLLLGMPSNSKKTKDTKSTV